VSIASLSRAAFPESQPGRHPRGHFRGLLRLHSRYGPLDRATAQGGLCRKASARPVTQPRRLPATRSNRQLSGWNLPPLAMRAVWAHGDIRARPPDSSVKFAPLDEWASRWAIVSLSRPSRSVGEELRVARAIGATSHSELQPASARQDQLHTDPSEQLALPHRPCQRQRLAE
jgi:hypothetical protein